MKAVVWHGKEDVRVDEVPDPKIAEPTDAIVRITSTAICGSDLHLYGPLASIMREGDILGHEPMGIVEEVGAGVHKIAPGDRVVLPFNISCGFCWFCSHGLQSQCETTQNPEHGTGASLFGYSALYGGVPGGQAEYLRVPHADYGPIKVPEGPADTRFLYLSDVLPTAWQAVKYAEVGPDQTVGVWGLGPIGQMCVRIAKHLGAARVIGVDLVPERLNEAANAGAETVDLRAVSDTADAVLEMTNGRGVDAAIEAVGLEAESSLADMVAQRAMVQMDRPGALRSAAKAVRRGGILSIIGVYTGRIQMFPLGTLFDRQITLRMGQANVRRWVDDLMPLLDERDVLGTETLATHILPLAEAPRAYEMFQKKEDGAIKIVLRP